MRPLLLSVTAAACGTTAPPARVPPPVPPSVASADVTTLEITSAAELVAPRIASSEFSEIRLAASPDGRMLLWGSTDRKGGPGGWNIWMSRRGVAGWGAPEAAPFDSDGWVVATVLGRAEDYIITCS